MTTESVSGDGDARRLLAEVRGLTRRVRVDQRATWLALSVLSAATFLGALFDYLFIELDCAGDGRCTFDRQGVLFYWPVALLTAYAAIAFAYIRIARSRGLGARVLPYAITGAALTGVFLAAWIGVRVYLAHHAVTDPLPEWVLVVDRLVAPWGLIGVALLVLARLERNVGLLVFTLLYLVVVLSVPVDFGGLWHPQGRAMFLPQQIIAGGMLLAGAIGFAVSARRQR